MVNSEFHRLRSASRDPAVNFFLLLPLALIHLAGRHHETAGVFSLIEQFLQMIGEGAEVFLWIVLSVSFLWSMGRISILRLRWQGGAALSFLEGGLWGFLLKLTLTSVATSGILAPLALHLGSPGSSQILVNDIPWESLSLAAGAGLYEEVLFRALLMSALYAALFPLLSRMHSAAWARGVAFIFALTVSSGIFAFAHAWGDPKALMAGQFIFRLFAGVLLGILFAWRGLAVTAYAHAAYDAQVLLNL